MTAPVQPVPAQDPAQAPGVQPVPAPEGAPGPAQPTPGAPWPPDDETMMQLQMDARFSIIEEPGDVTASEPADRQAVPSPGTTPPAPTQQAPAPPVKE